MKRLASNCLPPEPVPQFVILPNHSWIKIGHQRSRSVRQQNEHCTLSLSLYTCLHVHPIPLLFPVAHLLSMEHYQHVTPSWSLMITFVLSLRPAPAPGCWLCGLLVVLKLTRGNAPGVQMPSSGHLSTPRSCCAIFSVVKK